MLKRMREFFQKDNKTIFYLTSIVFAFFFLFAKTWGDDITFMRVENGSLADYWNYAVSFYPSWSSRVLINFVVFIFTDRQSFVPWTIYMGVSLYLLMYSFSALFAQKDHERECNVIITGMILLFPFRVLNSAGWVTTATTYLGPMACGFFSLLPLRKVNEGEKIKWYVWPFYMLALVYGANIEQMMVVILGSYLVGVIYLFLKKKFHPLLVVQLLLAVASFMFILLCPGNNARKNSEIITWYKDWGMLNMIDKVDLGYSTTMQMLWYGSQICLIITCCLFTFLLWKKYRRFSYAMTAGVPTLLMILLGPLRPITLILYPDIHLLTDDIERNGLVTVANRGNIQALGRYIVWAALLSLMIVAVLLLQNHIRELLVSFVLIGAGTASRVVLGFSPTVYASAFRTYSVMFFCIIAVACYVYANSIHQGLISKREVRNLSRISYVLILCSMINSMFMVIN
uniref:DUF6056 family protein n=1 Tax=Eubacterium cellulosolvens TaxID=29322 RepID=UPI000489186B|nr:DUF6056 family protein [[Eubacterium] cellulosolvens]